MTELKCNSPVAIRSKNPFLRLSLNVLLHVYNTVSALGGQLSMRFVARPARNVDVSSDVAAT